MTAGSTARYDGDHCTLALLLPEFEQKPAWRSAT